MSRSAPSVAEVFQQDLAIPELEATATDTCTLTRHYRLITPLYGGGFDAGIPDHTKAISETTVRGHLRFWWRATRGADEHATGLLENIKGTDQGAKKETSLLHDLEQDKDYQNLDDSKKRLKRLHTLEGWLFGCAAHDRELKRHPDKRLGPSRVGVRLDIDPEPIRALKAPFRFTTINGKEVVRPLSPAIAPAYAAFPLQTPDKQNQLKPLLNSKLVFAVLCDVPNGMKPDIEAALWAWQVFGGVGARTRRGFGAFTETPSIVVDQPDKLQEQLEAGLKTHVIPSKFAFGDGNTPYLKPDSRLVVKPLEWHGLLQKFRNFRQWRTFDNPFLKAGVDEINVKQPGRSFWPEPDSIRQLTERTRTNKPRPRDYPLD